MARLTMPQRVNVERVKRAQRISIRINDGDDLMLEFKGDISRLRHEIALAIQSHCTRENERVMDMTYSRFATSTL